MEWQAICDDQHKFLILIVLLCFSTGGQAEQCQRLAVGAVSTTADGLQLSVQAYGETQHVDFPLTRIPEECGLDRQRCNLQVVEGNAELFAFFTTRREDVSAVAISEFNTTDKTRLQLVETFVKTLPLDCSLVGVLFHGRQLIVPCVKLTTNQSYLELYRLSFGLDITAAQLTSISDKFVIYDPSTLSEFLYSANHKGPCISTSYLFFVDDGFLVGIPLDEELSIRSHSLIVGALGNDCQQPYRLKSYGNKVIVQCSGPHTLVYDPCDNEIDKVYPGAELYPCADADTVVVVAGGTVHLEDSGGEKHSEVIEFPWSGSTVAADCFNGDSQIPMFAFVLSNSSLLVLDFTSQGFTEVITGTCTSENEFCGSFKPEFVRSAGSILTQLDNSDGFNLAVTNISCPAHPSVAQLSVPTRPDLAMVLPVDGTHSCQCYPIMDNSSEPQNLVPTPATNPPTVGSGSNPSPETTNGHGENSTSPPTPDIDSATDSTGNLPGDDSSDTKGDGTVGWKEILAVIVALLIAIAGVVAILVVIWRCCCKRKHSHHISERPGTERGTPLLRLAANGGSLPSSLCGDPYGSQEQVQDGIPRAGEEAMENRREQREELEDGGGPPEVEMEEAEGDGTGEARREGDVEGREASNPFAYDTSCLNTDAELVCSATGESDVAGGLDSAHHYRHYHQDSVAQQHHSHMATEEDRNHRYVKASVMGDH